MHMRRLISTRKVGFSLKGAYYCLFGGWIIDFLVLMLWLLLSSRCKVLSPAGTPYVANQEAQDGQQTRNGQETWMAEEAQAGGGMDVDIAWFVTWFVEC